MVIIKTDRETLLYGWHGCKLVYVSSVTILPMDALINTGEGMNV